MSAKLFPFPIASDPPPQPDVGPSDDGIVDRLS